MLDLPFQDNAMQIGLTMRLGLGFGQHCLKTLFYYNADISLRILVR